MHELNLSAYNYDRLRGIQYNPVKNIWSRITNTDITLKQVIELLTLEDKHSIQSEVLLELDTPEHTMSAW